MGNIKAGVIGLGKIGMMYDLEPSRPHPCTHVYSYCENDAFDLVCGIDEDDEKRDTFLSIVSNAVFFHSINDALKSETFRNLDVVSICTPPNTHLPILIQLLDNSIGKIIICEKPLVSNVDEAMLFRKACSNHPNVTIIPNIFRRWIDGLRHVTKVIDSQEYGILKNINVRYTRGIYNTGSHMVDLLHMWTKSKISKVMALDETPTTALPEKSYSFYFEQDNGIKGYAEAVDDSDYYLFDIDLYFSKGKIEMRYSGDEVLYYGVIPHHLFDGMNQLNLVKTEKGLLNCGYVRNTLLNAQNVFEGKEKSLCTVEDAVYPVFLAEAVEQSYVTGQAEDVNI